MNIRENNLNKLSEDEIYDVLILGGGINGAVAAASLAAKGVSVALIEKGDFAFETSSNSSNLAWGGIKYLESYELLLVNNLCKSSSIKKAPEQRILPVTSNFSLGFVLLIPTYPDVLINIWRVLPV